MKNFKSVLLGMCFCLATFSSAFAQEKAVTAPVVAVDVSGLTPEQVAAIKGVVEQVKAQPKANTLANLKDLTNITPDKFKEWADAGTSAGKAVANFTKEVGMGADAFLKTDTGKYALLAILWKSGGDKVASTAINILLNVALFVVLICIWCWLARLFVFGQLVKKEITYNENTFLRWLGFNKTQVTIQREEEWLEKFSTTDKFWIMFYSRVISTIMLFIIVFMTFPKVIF